MFTLSNDPFITVPATAELSAALTDALALMRENGLPESHINELLILLASVRTAHARYTKRAARSSAPAS